MERAVRRTDDARVAHELGFADLRLEIALAAVERLPLVAVRAPREMKAVLAVLGEVSEQVGVGADGGQPSAQDHHQGAEAQDRFHGAGEKRGF